MEGVRFAWERREHIGVLRRRQEEAYPVLLHIALI
jgi:hypothetical protein